MKETSGELSQNQVPYEGGEGSKLFTWWSSLKRMGRLTWKNPVWLTSLAMTGLLLGVRQLALLEPLELYAYDRLMQLRPSLPPDPRLLVVEVTENDVESLEQWPLSDTVMTQLLQKLQQNEPAVIGLDMYRDRPIPPGNAELNQLFKNSDRIIPICRLGNKTKRGTPPPKNAPEERIGFADLAIGKGDVVRRALLFHDAEIPEGCTTRLSFSFQLARYYLEQKGIKPQTIQQNEQEYLKWGDIIFKPLKPHSGGYQKADTGGYQILLNYRSGDKLANSVTLTEVLEGNFDPLLVKDRIVLIGVSDPAENDLFYTPYSSQGEVLQKMPGVVVHGQIVSQLLSTVLDGRKLFWFIPESGEVVWIWLWSLTGAILVSITHNIRQLLLAETLAVGLLGGVSVIVFLQAGWIPVITPVLGLVISSTGVLTYNAYQNQQERHNWERLLQEQEDIRIVLQAMLKDKPLAPGTNQGETGNTPEGSAYQGETQIAPEGSAYQGKTQIAPDGSTDNGIPKPGSGEPPPPVKPPDQPEILAGRYEINRNLASGGFSLTYLAEDSHRPGKPQCVVKHLQPARRDERFLSIARRLFHTEAEILEKLGSHPQIPLSCSAFKP